MTLPGGDITFGSLFAGIGGFDLGFESAGMACKWQVEIDDYATKVLEKHWPNVHRERDIRECGKHNLERVDVICGGPPCQPISVAGKKKGKIDERWLWGKTIDLVGELLPTVAVFENPPVLLSFLDEFTDILKRLSEIGYLVEWECLPAGCFGAHFTGDRLFIVASRPPAGSLRWQRGWPPSMGSNQWGRNEFERLVCVEVQHGIPAGKIGRVSDGIRNRVDRLRCLGNAVVPQVAEWIGRQVVEALKCD